METVTVLARLLTGRLMHVNVIGQTIFVTISGSSLVTGMELSAKSNDQVMMNLSGRAGQAAVCRDLGRHLFDRLALLHGSSADQCERGGFSDRV